jgi:hypothetical protein
MLLHKKEGARKLGKGTIGGGKSLQKPELSLLKKGPCPVMKSWFPLRKRRGKMLRVSLRATVVGFVKAQVVTVSA